MQKRSIRKQKRTTSIAGDRRTVLAGEAAERFLVSHLPLIDRIVRSVARRHRLSDADRDDLGGLLRLKLVSEGGRALRRFQGRSRLDTYLTRVARNLAVDRFSRRNGRWRPSAVARRGGSLAVELDTLIHRDGLTAEEAAQLARGGDGRLASASQLEGIVEALVPHPPRRFESETTLERLSDSERADDHARRRENGRLRRRARRALAECLATFSPEERRLLSRRYRDGRTVSSLARRGGLGQRSLYSRFDRLLGELRKRLNAEGLKRRDLLAAFGEEPDPSFSEDSLAGFGPGASPNPNEAR